MSTMVDYRASLRTALKAFEKTRADGPRSMTVGVASERMYQLRGRLKELGISREQRFALMVTNYLCGQISAGGYAGNYPIPRTGQIPVSSRTAIRGAVSHFDTFEPGYITSMPLKYVKRHLTELISSLADDCVLSPAEHLACLIGAHVVDQVLAGSPDAYQVRFWQEQLRKGA